MKPILLCALLLLVVAAPPARAQLQTGNLYGTVVDDQGSALPGVTVTLSGQGPDQVQVTDAQGQFRFLGLPPGSRQIRTDLEGFSTVDYPNVNVNVGRNTTIEVTMSGAVEDVITVTAESPLLDERRISSGQTVSETELEKIPTARDPWAILQQTPGVLTDRINVGGNEAPPADVPPGAGGDPMAAFAEVLTGEDLVPGVSAGFGTPPADVPADVLPDWYATPRDPWAILQQSPGVLTDRINVGGNESGQQSRYIGPGAQGAQSVWSVDGVVITDMAALGSSPTYYDFDSFEEMQLSTSGNDATIATGGVVLNMVTKRGTNEWRGSGRYFISDDDWSAGEERVKGTVSDVLDFGAELGGPIVRDRLWIWGSYGAQRIDLLNPGGRTDAAPPPDAAPGTSPFFRFIETMYRRGYTRGCDVPGMNVFTTPGTDCGPIKIQLQNVYGTGALQGILPDPFAGPKIHVGVGQPPTGRIADVVVDPSDPSGNTVYSTGTTGGTWKTDNFLTTDPGGPRWVPVETTWNQSRFGDDPTAQKLEDTHIFSSNFYLTGLYSVVNGGFQLAPGGGRDGTVELDSQPMTGSVNFYAGWVPGVLDGGREPLPGYVPPIAIGGGPRSFFILDRKDFIGCPNGGFLLQGNLGDPVDLGNGSSFQPFQNSFQLYQTERPQEQYKADACNFFNTGSLSHELKFGAGYRDAEVAELDTWGGGTWFLGGPAVKEKPQDQPADQPVAQDDPAITDELLLGVEHAILPEFVVGLNLTYKNGERILDDAGDLNFAPLNNFPTIPLSQLFGGRFRLRSSGGQSRAAAQVGPGGSMPVTTPGAPDGPSVLLVSNGQSTGEAFTAHVLSDAPFAIEGYAILEPVAAPAAEVARLAGELDAAGAVQAVVEAYCFQFDGMVPAAGAAYRFAPPEVQQAFAPLARVLDAAERVKDAGGLLPDTELDSYFPAISQWAVWSKEKGFDLESFGEAWLGHVRKNVEQAGERMTAELEQAVRDRIPGRWQDIQKILAEAGG